MMTVGELLEYIEIINEYKKEIDDLQDQLLKTLDGPEIKDLIYKIDIKRIEMNKYMNKEIPSYDFKS